MHSLRHELPIVAALVGIALAGYGRALPGYFLSDDVMIGAVCPDGVNVNWRHVGQTFLGDWRAIPGFEGGYYRPLVIVSQALDLCVWGLRPLGFHLTNILLHAANGYLIYRLGRRLLARPDMAMIAALLFVALPLHPESVAWISGRTDVLCTLPSLACMCSYVAFRQDGRRGYLLGALSWYLVALLTKENAAILPLILAAYDLTARRGVDPLRRLLFPWAPFLAILAAYLVWRRYALGSTVSGRGAAFFLPESWNAPIQFVRDVGFDIKLLLFPFNRSYWSGQKQWLYLGLFVAQAPIWAVAIRALWRREIVVRPVVQVLLMLLASLLPFFNAIRVHPALMGSRMLYSPTALWCLLCAALGVGRNPRVTAATWAFALAALLLVLNLNLQPWIKSGVAIKRVQDAYESTFGDYRGMEVECLPAIYHGAYLALYNAQVFCTPFVKAAPKFENFDRFRIRFDLDGLRPVVRPDTSCDVWERLQAGRSSASLWPPAGAPLEQTRRHQCELLSSSAGRFRFRAAGGDPQLISVAPNGTTSGTDIREQWIFLLLDPIPDAPPQLFWTTAQDQAFDGKRVVDLQPLRRLTDHRLQRVEKEGFTVFSARLDSHSSWPGMFNIREIRLDPASSSGEFSIAWMNIVGFD